MDMIRRAYIQTRKEVPSGTIEAFHETMIMNMVRWIKLRVYSKRDWPREFGEYPKHLEKAIKAN